MLPAGVYQLWAELCAVWFHHLGREDQGREQLQQEVTERTTSRARVDQEYVSCIVTR